MKKVIVIIGMGFISIATIIAGTNPQMENQLVEENNETSSIKWGKKKITSASASLLIQPKAFQDYNIDLFASTPSSVSSTLTQPDAFEDYGIDLNEKFDFQDNSLLSIKKVKALFQWSTRIAHFKFQIFGSRTTPLEVYAKTKEAIHYTTYIMETMGQLVFTEQDESTEERAPQFLKLFFNFV